MAEHTEHAHHIVLIGGHHDGAEYTINRADPPPLISTAAPAIGHHPIDVTTIRIDYYLELDPTGHPSRDDQGRLHYRCH